MTPEARFLALQAQGDEAERIQCLSGNSMQWSDGVWLFDLEPFLGYWRSRAQHQNMSLGQLWRQVLAWNFGQETHFLGDYRAAVAAHPWRSLLLLEAMTGGRHQGLAVDGGQRGQSLFHKMTWPTWGAVARSMAAPWKQARRKGLQPPTLRKQIERFQTSLLRLGIEGPLASGRLNQAAIAKRFGAEVALLWSWTLHPPPDLQDFPWREAQWHEPTRLRRTTDYPLQLWEQIHPLLLADLDRLQGMLAGQAELLVELGWELWLEDAPPLVLSIGFRSPHDLREEAGSHKTLLTRLQKSLEGGMASFMANRLGLPLPLITGWELTLTRSLILPDQVLDFFGEVQTDESPEEQLRKLENQLPLPLLQFQDAADWEPESSFQPYALGAGAFSTSLQAAAQPRPLFHFSPPKPLEGEPASGLEFLEEASGKWWKQAAGESRRSYYRWCDERGQVWWVFHDEAGDWFLQGRYD